MYSPSSVDPVTAQHFKYFLLFLLPLSSQYPSVSAARTSAAFQKFGGSNFFAPTASYFQPNVQSELHNGITLGTILHSIASPSVFLTGNLKTVENLQAINK